MNWPKDEETPQDRGCGGAPASFVFCNFNKQLKFDPVVFQSWLETLQAVEGSVLCLQKNPKESMKYINKFVSRFDESLLPNIRWVEFDHSIGPFETKKRGEDMCNLALDTDVYGSHTTCVESLWAG